MAVAPYLSKLVFGGSLYGLDSWSIGMHLHGPDAPVEDPQVFADDIQAWVTSADSMIPSAAKLEFIKWNGIDPATGKYALPGITREYTYPGGIQGAMTNGPAQICMGISLRTAVSRGRGHAGRVFPPAGHSGDFGADGRLSAAKTLLVANAFTTLLQGIDATTTAHVVVFSKLAQTITPVTHCAVGRVLDTQRRRRSSLLEEYTVGAQL